MSKTILVPTDFRVASLNTLKLALESFKGEPVHVVLMHAMHLDDSIMDLLFYSPQKTINSLLTPEFNEALEILKNRYEAGIKDLKIKLFHGRNQRAFEVFIDASVIDEIYVAKSYKLQTSNGGFDPGYFIKDAEVPVFEMNWEAKVSANEHEQLIALFN